MEYWRNTGIKYEGKSIAASGSPREILKSAYQMYDFLSEDIWLSMLKDRNDMTHIYDGEAAGRLVGKILKGYIPEFQKLRAQILLRYRDILETL